MITRIEVNGFKSLIDFELDIHQGLNILVGPNGAGKTNIVQFFEFLSNLVKTDIGTAVTNVGGAGAIFQKLGEKKYVENIDCKIYGSYSISNSELNYEYSFKIHRSPEKDSVYFSRQQLKIREYPIEKKRLQKHHSDNWDLDVEYTMGNEFFPQVNFNSFIAKKLERIYGNNISTNEHQKEIREYIMRNDSGYHSILRSIWLPIFNSFFIYSDLAEGEIYNIVPTKVKELEDSATPKGIKKDGSGLSASLYAMKKGSDKQNRKTREYGDFENDNSYHPETLKTVVNYLKAANSSIYSLDIENDQFSNKLVVKIVIKSGDYEAVLPLSSMSDGTIKWLTLITAILTSETIFSIEEPENYLHPWMQAEIVDIMRNHLSSKSEKSFILMTTHSESLINRSKPEEIVLISLVKGKTAARRLDSTMLKTIKEEISNTGFGLGYFYYSNALNDE